MDIQVGWVAEQIDGTFKGAIRTLTVHEQITIRPVPGSARGAASSYDVLIGSGALMGSAESIDGKITIELHSPELAAPIIACLAAAEGPREWLLIWQSC